MIDQKVIHKKFPSPIRCERGTHAGLWLDKYILDQTREKTESQKTKSRSNLVNEVAELPEPPEYSAFFTRWEAMLKEYGAQTRRARVRGRMAVGLGSESLLEASIALHRTYGLPYIPGSALKGLAASYAHHRLGDEWRKGGKFHRAIFGDTDEAGYMTFFDALYIPGTGQGQGQRALAPDIITIHHQKYYQNAEAVPLDSDDPNPVPFLSATGDYLLALSAPDLEQQMHWINITFQILADALDKLGIGAKTSSGYGRIAFIDQPVRPANLKFKKAEGMSDKSIGKATSVKPADHQLKKAERYKKEIESISLTNVARKMFDYCQKWEALQSKGARLLLARAIVEKVQQAGHIKDTVQAKRIKEMTRMEWYKNILVFLDEHRGGLGGDSSYE